MGPILYKKWERELEGNSVSLPGQIYLLLVVSENSYSTIYLCFKSQYLSISKRWLWLKSKI